VIFGRATQHLLRDATSGTLRDATYIVDPASKTHDVLEGEIKGGVLTIEPHHIYLEGELPFYMDIELDNGHMRISRQSDGKLIGYMGGFTDWKRYAYMSTARPFQDAAAIEGYHALKKMADADPDPSTGFRWVAASGLAALAFPDANGPVVAELCREFGRGA